MTLLNTQSRLMGVEVVRFKKAHIIGRNHRNTVCYGNVAGTCDVFFLEGSFGARQLKVITIAED